MLNEKVGKNLRILRLMNEMSQDDVEFGVNVSRSTLSKIENGTGKIDLIRLEQFAKFFKVEVVTILTMSNLTEYENDSSEPIVHEKQVDYRKTDVELARSQEKIVGLKKEIGFLKQEISVNKSQIKDKEKIIQLLSK